MLLFDCHACGQCANCRPELRDILSQIHQEKLATFIQADHVNMHGTILQLRRLEAWMDDLTQLEKLYIQDAVFWKKV